MKRLRAILDKHRPDAHIDLHSNNKMSRGATSQYATFFPYLDKIWFGENFDYNSMPPETWLTDVSGIPFGVMGDMLQGGGNPWLGLLFGMTSRPFWENEGHRADPLPIWRLWDTFNIAESTMIGFWHPHCPVKTNNRDILATIFLHHGSSALIIFGNWSKQDQTIQLNVDWQTLGMDARALTIVAPFIHGMQRKRTISARQQLKIQARKGLIMIASNTKPDLNCNDRKR